MSDGWAVSTTMRFGRPSQAEFQLLKEIHHAGDVAPDFTLPLLDGGELSLSDLGGNAAR